MKTVAQVRSTESATFTAKMNLQTVRWVGAVGGAITKHGPVFLAWQVGSKEEEKKNRFECWRGASIKLSGVGECRVSCGNMG